MHISWSVAEREGRIIEDPDSVFSLTLLVSNSGTIKIQGIFFQIFSINFLIKIIPDPLVVIVGIFLMVPLLDRRGQN